jgi:hypothetical protein
MKHKSVIYELHCVAYQDTADELHCVAYQDTAVVSHHCDGIQSHTKVNFIVAVSQNHVQATLNNRALPIGNYLAQHTPIITPYLTQSVTIPYTLTTMQLYIHIKEMAVQ